jgi:Flp pilus assembly protein TadG
MLSLSMDLGRVQFAKRQLEDAVDAAARYAAAGLSDNTAPAKAIASAAENSFDGQPLILSNGEITVGNYNDSTRTFTSNGTPTNAVRVKINKNSGRIVTMMLAKFIGLPSVSLTTDSFAYDKSFGSATTPTGAIKGFAGTNWFNFNGNVNVRAWDSSTNTVLGPGAWVAAQTKGSVNLNNGVVINGELQSASTPTMNGATITKGVTSLPAGFGTYAAPTAPGNATNMGNYNGPSGASQTFAAGVYRFDSFSVPSGKTVTFSGPSQVYVNGSINITGAINTFGNLPSNLKLYNTSSAGVDIGSNASSPIYAEIYAPNSPFNLNARTFYGSIVATGISVNSNFNMYVDARTTTGGFAGSGGPGAAATPTISTVRPTTVN